MIRLHILIKGVVQGVGFRPYIFRLAKSFSLTGFIRNNGEGVVIQVQGKKSREFLDKLLDGIPPLAKITSTHVVEIPIKTKENEFEILETSYADNSTYLPPDIALCQDCVAELFDPINRFYLYPFISCMHCGPRLTITQQLPYDRAQTTMRGFTFCRDCNKDYYDPENRRFHAQPLACAACGPQLSHSLETIIKKISSGHIVGIKGVGGYQLICDAKNEEAILKLRSRKKRNYKPFAIMALNIVSVKNFTVCDAESEKLLTSISRPIVLCPRKSNDLPDIIAPGLKHLGVMLPYMPLHYLIFHGLSGFPNTSKWWEEINSYILVVTSGNIHNQSLIKEDAQAEQLEELVDLLVSYNRKIVSHADDSVMRIVNQFPIFIRRSRGFVPEPIKLSQSIPSVLAVGSHLKTTICLTRDDEAFVSQHIGDLSNKATIDCFHQTLCSLQKLLNIKPEFIAHDLHPNFYTTHFAKTFGIPCFGIQHHFAHLMAVAAEYGLNEPILGIALDGYGYGDDKGAWGGELMLLKKNTYLRLGSLLPIPQPGGDKATIEPWRMAVAILYQLDCQKEIEARFSLCNTKYIIEMIQKRLNTPYTSSCGRLFDAASALLGIQRTSNYEGHAAMALESCVTKIEVLGNGWELIDTKLNLLPLFKFLLSCNHIEGANFFHGTLIAALTDWIVESAKKHNTRKVLLSGGCFLNKVLSEGLIRSLVNNDIYPYLPRKLPPNDGGISLGQAWVVGLQQLGISAC